MSTPIININFDKHCKRCGKPGAMPNGICMKCFNKAIQAGEFDHILKPMKPIDKVE